MPLIVLIVCLTISANILIVIINDVIFYTVVLYCDETSKIIKVNLMYVKLENKASKPNRGKLLALYEEIGANNLVSIKDIEKIAKDLKRRTGSEITIQDIRNLLSPSRGFMFQHSLGNNQGTFLRNDSSTESIINSPSSIKTALPRIIIKDCSEEMRPIAEKYRDTRMSNYAIAQDIEKKRTEFEERIRMEENEFNQDIQRDREQLDRGKEMEKHLEELIRLMSDKENN
jgi:hypothetical protein